LIRGAKSLIVFPVSNSLNLFAGASRIRFRDYLMGTAVGMLPGILSVSIFADRLLLVIRNPERKHVAMTMGAALLLWSTVFLDTKLG